MAATALTAPKCMEKPRVLSCAQIKLKLFTEYSDVLFLSFLVNMDSSIMALRKIATPHFLMIEELVDLNPQLDIEIIL